jgi:DNA-binding transcriptional LysR family regulator
MDLNDLALFARVVESGSFTAAAKVLGLPKSSITRRIARLEGELQVRLIQRTTRQRGVTDAGRDLYERVGGAVAALDEAAETVRARGHAPAGIVRVTANPDAAMIGVPEAIVALRAKLPAIHVELILTTRVVDLVAEGIDLGIRAGRLADSSLIAKRIGVTNAGLFASKAYLKKRGRPAKLADLSAHDCVLFRGQRGKSTWDLDGPRGKRSIEVAGVASADDFGFVVELLTRGTGIGMLPLFLAHRHAVLERVLPEYVVAGAALHLVMPSGSYVPARVNAVRDFLLEHLAATLSECQSRT